MRRLCNLAVMGSLEQRALQCRGEERRVYRILPGSSESCRVSIIPQAWDGDAVSYGTLVLFRRHTVSVCAWQCLGSSPQPRTQLPDARGTGPTQRALVALTLTQ